MSTLGTMATSEANDERSVDLPARENGDDVIEIEDEEEEDDTEEDECCICQDVVSLVQQGFLPSCDHRFHFDCIVTWSKVTNLCPLCKLQFNEVVRKGADGAVVHRESIANTKQIFRPDPRDHDIQAQLRLVNNVRCEICGRGDDEHVLLMCEAPHCMNASHTYCVGLDEVPTHSWYCSVHQGGPARASDLITRPASTVSSRRQTRRLATLVSNIMRGVGTTRRGRGASGTGASRSTTRRARGRLTLPDSEGLGMGGGRPIRGVALSYAVHMSRELQAIQQRADAMFARGDLGTSALYAPPRGTLLGSRSTSTRSVTDQMWEDRALSQRQQSEAAATMRSGIDAQPSTASRGGSNRIASTFASEYRDIAKRMTDAASHDNYASTVSLTIPKTARLRLVSSVKAFFGKLNEREKVAALEAGCLSLLFSWVRVGDLSDSGSTNPQSKGLHPHVLEAVLTTLEALPVRKEDLSEVSGFNDVLDELSTQPDIDLDYRERCIVLSEKWRAIDPPPPRAPSVPVSTAPRTSHIRAQPEPSLPTIQSFTTSIAPSHGRSAAKRKATKPPVENPKKVAKPAQEEWTTVAVDYVKTKLYPLYKDSKGKMSKDQFKTVVKQVVERFRTDAAKMQSSITEANGTQLSSIAKQRLMQLLDQVYRSSRASTPASSSSSSLHPPRPAFHGNSGYSAVPSTSAKRPRTS